MDHFLTPSIIVDSDKRQLYLYEIVSLLDPDNVFLDNNCQEGSLMKASFKTMFLPMTGSGYEELLDLVADGGFVICGKASPKMKDIGTKRKLHVVPLLEDENFVYNNAVITAEIAVAQAILDHPKALCDITAAVTGGGRIALSTVDKLIKLGCKKVLCFARNPKQLDRASYLGAYAYELPIGDRLSGVDIVFNTIPAPVIANEELLNLPKGAILYELASSSGFDLAFAVTSGIDSRSALGLPGKFAPMSAASLIWENSQKYLVL